jgi:hypothetical protein
MKLAHWISLGTLPGLFAVAFGCGGVGDANALFNGGETGNGGAAASGAGTNTSQASTTTSTGSNTATSSGSGNGSTTSSGKGSSGSSGSSSTGGSASVPCGPVTCPLDGQGACCWDDKDFNPGPQAFCVQGPEESAGCATEPIQDGFETRIECKDSGQCGQKICCAHRVGFNGGQLSYFDLVACKEACAGLDDLALCELAAPACPDGTVCKPSALLPDGYAVCSAPGS